MSPNGFAAPFDLLDRVCSTSVNPCPCTWYRVPSRWCDVQSLDFAQENQDSQDFRNTGQTIILRNLQGVLILGFPRKILAGISVPRPPVPSRLQSASRLTNILSPHPRFIPPAVPVCRSRPIKLQFPSGCLRPREQRRPSVEGVGEQWRSSRGSPAPTRRRGG